MVMKKPAQTIVVGVQGHAVLTETNSLSVIGGTSRAEMTPESRALLASADTLEDTIHYAASREAALAQICSSDEELSDRSVIESFRHSKMLLECWGLLRG